jgi:hypothetical protein
MGVPKMRSKPKPPIFTRTAGAVGVIVAFIASTAVLSGNLAAISENVRKVLHLSSTPGKLTLRDSQLVAYVSNRMPENEPWAKVETVVEKTGESSLSGCKAEVAFGAEGSFLRVSPQIGEAREFREGEFARVATFEFSLYSPQEAEPFKIRIICNEFVSSWSVVLKTFGFKND